MYMMENCMHQTIKLNATCYQVRHHNNHHSRHLQQYRNEIMYI